MIITHTHMSVCTQVLLKTQWHNVLNIDLFKYVWIFPHGLTAFLFFCQFLEDLQPVAHKLSLSCYPHNKDAVILKYVPLNFDWESWKLLLYFHYEFQTLVANKSIMTIMLDLLLKQLKVKPKKLRKTIDSTKNKIGKVWRPLEMPLRKWLRNQRKEINRN